MMKLIESKVEILTQGSGIEGVYKQIELAGRTCYKSEDKITPTSAKEFTDRMIKSKHCYTGETEVLTEKGWIKFRNYNGEKVAVINKNCSFKGFESPSRIVNYSYKGNFYYYPSLGIEVTDGHNMFGVFRESKNNFYNNSSYNLFSCNTPYRDNNGREKTLGERMFKSPRHCIKPISLNPYGELIGFWLGDGCYSPETKNKLVFHLKKERKIEYLRQICNELGYIFEKKKSNYYTVTNNNIGSSFSSLFYNNGKRLSLQYFPSIDIAYSIINGLINSDGSLGINTKTITFTNTSKSIIDWLLMYAPICGYSISDRGVSHNTSLNNPVYKVLLLDTNYTLNNDSRNKDSKVIITNKVEEVYCVTVSTGLIMVRGTNGVTTICGNCAMLEHGTIYLTIAKTVTNIGDPIFYVRNKYSKVNEDDLFYFITTNMRVLVENNRLDDLQYQVEPTEFHEKRITVKFICDRGVSHEFVRHRVFSFAQESTRYCNYSKDKFGNELTFIIPNWYSKTSFNKHGGVEKYLQECENLYFSLLDQGRYPQEVRCILPNMLKTELIMTGFESDWEHFFELRCSKAAHPDAQKLANELKELIYK
nr:MAG TPA: Thymidylate synthase complementing protein [Caudoviricetes sp.]